MKIRILRESKVPITTGRYLQTQAKQAVGDFSHAPEEVQSSRMEIAMNITDYILTGGAILNWWIVPIMLFVGFITPWPYNYWRLKKHNKNCH